jgi:ABC-type lipoprotein release transport system permease subunit
MNVFSMAWRNVWRNSQRSLIGIAAMALALWAELVYSGMMNGILVDMSGDVTEMDIGDVQIFTKGWASRPALRETVDDRALLPKLEAAGLPATARLQAGGLAASGEQSAGVALIGLDPAQDAKALSIYTAVAEGAWLDPADPKGVVVGRGLARTLGLKLGSELVVLSQGADGSMANDLYKVRGILMNVASGTDRGSVFMNSSAFRDLMTLPEGAHRIVVRVPPGRQLDEVRAQVEGIAQGYAVQDWRKLNPFMAQMLDAAKVQIKVVYFVLYIAVAILVLNAMLMAIFERIREFGVLKAIGYGPVRVFAMMVLEGLLQAVVATGVGVVFAAPAAWYLATYGVDVGALAGVSMMGMTLPPIWHGVYTADALSTPIIMLFTIVFAAALYPALKAALIRPVEAMHHL